MCDLLGFDHVSSLDVMDEHTLVHIGRELLLALITLDSACRRRPGGEEVRR